MNIPFTIGLTKGTKSGCRKEATSSISWRSSLGPQTGTAGMVSGLDFPSYWENPEDIAMEL